MHWTRLCVRLNMYLVCNTNTTLCAECPSAVTITPGEPYEAGDVLTCMANGYDPVYTWTGTAANGAVSVSHTGSSYTLPEGVFDLTCTAAVSQLTCTDSASVSGTATSVPGGNYRI